MPTTDFAVAGVGAVVVVVVVITVLVRPHSLLFTFKHTSFIYSTVSFVVSGCMHSLFSPSLSPPRSELAAQIFHLALSFKWNAVVVIANMEILHTISIHSTLHIYMKWRRQCIDGSAFVPLIPPVRTSFIRFVCTFPSGAHIFSENY